MKVLLVSHGFPPRSVAGVERLTAQTAEALAEGGSEVTVLTRQPGEAGSSLSLRRRSSRGVSILSIEGGGVDYGRFPRREPDLERIFERVIFEVEPEVVLITHLMHHSPGYVEVAHRWGVPVALEMHDFFAICPRAHLQRISGEVCEGPEGGAACAVHCFPDQEASLLRWSLRSRSFGQALDDADALLAPSRFVAETVEQAYGKEVPIQVVENAIGPLGPVLRSPKVGRDGLRLASVGVTVEHKGFGVVLEALRIASLPKVSYTIFGVPLRPQSQRLRSAADLIPGLEFRLADAAEPQHLPALLADVDLMLVPSVVPETYSIVTREAFACGLPVIASRLGALNEAIDPDGNGWLFDPGDAVGLAQLLRELDEHPEMIVAASAGASSSRVVRLDERTGRIEAVLSGIVAAGARRPSMAGAELAQIRKGLVQQDTVDRR